LKIPLLGAIPNRSTNFPIFSILYIEEITNYERNTGLSMFTGTPPREKKRKKERKPTNVTQDFQNLFLIPGINQDFLSDI